MVVDAMRPALRLRHGGRPSTGADRRLEYELEVTHMSDSRREKLVGPVVSLPTFCDEDHNLLLDRQRKHIRWLVANGIEEGNGVLLIAGGYGECYFLEESEQFALIDVLAEEAAGKAPTMVGIFELSARAAARKSAYAAAAGIDFIELGLPHYSLPSEEDVYLFHQYVNDRADIGIMSYNNFWTMPPPVYEMTESLFERLLLLENMAGVKWSSRTEEHYVAMLDAFSDRLSFVDNRMSDSLGARHGMRAFVDFWGNVAPRLSQEKWRLFRDGRYDELDELMERVHKSPEQKLAAEAPAWVGVADGVIGHLRWETLGLYVGPTFPAQAPPSEEYVEYTRKLLTGGEMEEWVDWDQAVLD